jgi:hypothetical protein
VEAEHRGVGVGEVQGLGVEGEFGLDSRDDGFGAAEAVALGLELQQGVGDALVGELGRQGVRLGRGDYVIVLAV